MPSSCALFFPFFFPISPSHFCWLVAGKMGLPSAEAVLADLTLFGLDCGKEAEEAEAVAEKRELDQEGEPTAWSGRKDRGCKPEMGCYWGGGGPRTLQEAWCVGRHRRQQLVVGARLPLTMEVPQ